MLLIAAVRSITDALVNGFTEHSLGYAVTPQAVLRPAAEGAGTNAVRPEMCATQASGAHARCGARSRTHGPVQPCWRSPQSCPHCNLNTAALVDSTLRRVNNMQEAAMRCTASTMLGTSDSTYSARSLVRRDEVSALQRPQRRQAVPQRSSLGGLPGDVLERPVSVP